VIAAVMLFVPLASFHKSVATRSLSSRRNPPRLRSCSREVLPIAGAAALPPLPPGSPGRTPFGWRRLLHARRGSREVPALFRVTRAEGLAGRGCRHVDAHR